MIGNVENSLYDRILGGIIDGLLDASAEIERDEPLQEEPEDKRLVTFDDLIIRTTDRRLIQFRPNVVQARYADMIAPGWRHHDYRIRSVRDQILKARREGITTLVAALFFCDTINTPNTVSAELAHDSDTSVRVFGMIQRFYDHLPEKKKRPLKYSNRRELVFEDIGSSYFVGTAGNVHFGRSDTIQNVHGTEVAFWPNAGDLLTGLEEAVPPDGNIILESTANGLGNWYQEEWVQAETGNSAYRPVFFAWFEFPEYAETPPPDYTPNQEEKELQDAYDLSIEQVYWWKLKKKSKKKKMPQEYPSNPDEAFIASGNPYFDRERLKVIQRSLNSDPRLAPIDLDIPGRFPLLRKYAKSEDCQVEFYKAPEEGRNYCIGADVAEGLDDTGKSDFDSADVCDWTTWEQVCHINGTWDTHEYGLLLAELGSFYNRATVAVERNNHGYAVLNALIYSAQYDAVYFHEEFDEHKNEANRKPGWPTNIKTKFLALDTLDTAIDEQGVHIRSRATISEMITFVKKPGGKAGGEGSCHDDRVMSLSICLVVMLTTKPVESIKFSC